ncbi:hypothetical protein FRC03_006911 [Tulasnella sp. 419]|nr:hypothetical protein FRC03_006911 [Tulasnella sp. 419]
MFSSRFSLASRILHTPVLGHAVGVNAARTATIGRRFGVSATTSWWHDPTQTSSGPKAPKAERNFGVSATTSWWHDPTQTSSGPKIPKTVTGAETKTSKAEKIDGGEAKH